MEKEKNKNIVIIIFIIIITNIFVGGIYLKKSFDNNRENT